MHGSTDGTVLDAHVVRADVVALRIVRAATGREAGAPGRAGNVTAITSLRTRRQRRSPAPPYFPGDAA
jgi:hypothetical protein